MFWKWILLLSGTLLLIMVCLFVFFRPRDNLNLILYEQSVSPATGAYGAGQFFVAENTYIRPVTRPGRYMRFIDTVGDERLLFLNYSTQSLDMISLTGRVLKSIPVNTLSFDGLRVMSVPANGEWLVSSYPSVVSRLNLQSGREELILQQEVAPGSFNPLGFLSPDGKWMAVLTTMAEDDEIYDALTVVTYKGKHGLPLLDHLDIQSTSLRWSPDSQWIAVETTRQPPEIYRVRRDGSEKHHLEVGGAEWVELQNWSQDGKWLYFINSVMGSHSLARLHILTGEALTITTLPAGYCCLQFSPDNRWATYQTLEGVWRVHLESGERVLLSPLHVNTHVWAADSQHIILGAWLSEDVALYEMRYDGSQVRELIRTSGKRHFLTTLLTPQPRHFHPLPVLLAGIFLLAVASRPAFFSAFFLRWQPALRRRFRR